MNKLVSVRWLILTIFSLIFVGCGDSQEYVFTNSPNPDATSRQVTLQFDYSDVLAQIPAAVGGYRIVLYSSAGEAIAQHDVGGRVTEKILTEVTLDTFVLRVVGLDAGGNPIGYRDFSVPSGVDAVTLRVDLLLADAPPQATYHAPDGIAARLAFLRHPGDTRVDANFSVAVVALDAAGYRVGQPSGAVSLSYTGSGTLSGTKVVNFTDGVAVFSGLTVSAPGAGNFLTATVPGLALAQSLPFAVSASTPEEPSDPMLQVPLDPQTTTAQQSPVVATTSDGNFVALWTDAAANAIVGQRFSSAGATLGERFLVVSPAAYSYDIAGLPGGGFVAVWSVQVSPGMWEAKVQRFSADNQPLGAAETLPDGYFIRVASDSQGRYVVSYALTPFMMAQRFDFDGTRLGAPIEVNAEDFNVDAIGASQPSVGCDRDGNFTVVWIYNTELGQSIAGRPYRADGTPLSSTFLIATGNDSDNLITNNPSIDMNAFGQSVIAYEYVDSISKQVRARTYSYTAGLGHEIVVTTTDAVPSYSPEVAIAPDASFVVSWLRQVQASPLKNQVWLARYNADATLSGVAARTGTGDTSESSQRVAISANGALGVVWMIHSTVDAVYYSLFPSRTP